MWTLVAVLVVWSIVSLVAGVILGGVVALRRRDLGLEAGRLHPWDAVDYRLVTPVPVVS